jgi:2'-5' RNA ligase
MPFAVHLFFDANIEAVVKAAWKELADGQIAPYMFGSANRPHFTLAIYQELELQECEQRLQSFATTQDPLPVEFQYLGIFPNAPAAVFLGAPVTVPLLSLHAQLHDALRPVAVDPDAYYLPGNWVPHCTLALDLEPERITPALEIARRLSLPLKGLIEEIGVDELQPVRHLFAFALGQKT